MAAKTVQEFLADRSLLAIKIRSADLSGFFRKSIQIPRNTTGMALFPDGSSTLVEEGGEVSGTFDLVLGKRGEIALRLVFPDLKTSDGLGLSASCGVTLELALQRLEFFRDFCRTLFSFPGSYTLADLKDHLVPELRVHVAAHALRHPAADLHGAEHADSLGSRLRDTLERFLFDAGVRTSKLTELSFHCADHARRLEEDKRRQSDDRRAAEVIGRKEERLRRLAGILKDQDVQGLLARVPDEKLRGLLYAKLMEDDAVQITAEELVSKAKDCGEEVVQVIWKAMEGLLSSGASVAHDEIETEHAELIFAAAGRKILAFDPAEGGAPRVYAFRDPLRSVRCADTAAGPVLIAGAKRGLSTVALDGDREIREYPLPGGRAVRGGINSATAAGAQLYATHSEYGLVRWEIDRPGQPPEAVYEEITKPNRTTRCVCALDKDLYFASGHHVYRAPLDGAGDPAKYVSSIESPVTCIAVAARTVFAGTESGAILCWKADAPDQPVVLARKRESIVNLRLAKICAIPHLIYSTRDLSVRARVIGQNLETSYESGGAAVGVLDAASDLIAASDADGRRVLLWKATSPAKPSGEVEVWKQAESPVLDLWMKKGRARSA